MTVSDYLASWATGLPTPDQWVIGMIVTPLTIAAVVRLVSRILLPAQGR